MRSWVAARAPLDLYFSVITILELEVGITEAGSGDSSRMMRLQAWLEDLVLVLFADRVLSIDLPVTRTAARLHPPGPCPNAMR